MRVIGHNIISAKKTNLTSSLTSLVDRESPNIRLLALFAYDDDVSYMQMYKLYNTNKRDNALLWSQRIAASK